MVKFSFSIPTRNNLADLSRLYDSIKKQDYKNYEVIVVDKSTDSKIEEFCKKEKIRFVRQTGDGLPDARNLGWRNAKGEWVNWIDADHILDKTYLSTLIKFMKKNKDIEIIAPNQIYLANNLLQKVVQAELLTNQKYGRLATVVKKKVFAKINGWDSDDIFGEDRHIMQKLERFNIGFSKDSKVYVETVKNLSHFYKQSRWYGKTLLKYILLRPGGWKVLLNICGHVGLTLLLISGLVLGNVWIAGVPAVIFFVEGIVFAISSGKIFGLLVPLLKIFRSFIELFYVILSVPETIGYIVRKNN